MKLFKKKSIPAVSPEITAVQRSSAIPMRFPDVIDPFEKELYDWGAVIIKFWVQIDKVTQLRRFTDRQNTPEKQWKITDEDWRNREKWDDYEVAIDEMIAKTSTENAPWFIIQSNNKYYARIQAIRTVIDEIEKKLNGR